MVKIQYVGFRSKDKEYDQVDIKGRRIVKMYFRITDAQFALPELFTVQSTKSSRG